MEPVTLETPRLLLRPLSVADAEAVFVWCSDPAVNRFMPYPLYRDVEQVRAWLSTAEQTETSLPFGFVRKADGLLIGSGDISLDAREPGAWGFGYNLRRDCWNQGYATEATRAMIAYVHAYRGARVIVANHAAANPASGRVMEKCGLHYDHDGQYSKLDGSEVFPAKFYRMDLDEAGAE